jgi:hypothetical protein
VRVNSTRILEKFFRRRNSEFRIQESEFRSQEIDCLPMKFNSPLTLTLTLVLPNSPIKDVEEISPRDERFFRKAQDRQ